MSLKHLSHLLLALTLPVFTYSQDDHFQRMDELKRSLKIKTETVYQYNSNGDSSLITFTTYNALGNKESTYTFSKNTEPISMDTFFYDSKHSLVKQVHRNKVSGNNVSLFKMNAAGKVLEQFTEGDSIYLRNFNSFDAQGRWVRSVQFDRKGDSFITTRTIKQRGNKLTVVINNGADPAQSEIFYFDKTGKLQRLEKIFPNFKAVAVYAYDDKGLRTGFTNTVTRNKRQSTFSNKVTHYGNGLPFIVAAYQNKRLTGITKIFYTYH